MKKNLTFSFFLYMFNNSMLYLHFLTVFGFKESIAGEWTMPSVIGGSSIWALNCAGIEWSHSGS